MDAMLEKLFKDSAGQAMHKDATAAGIKMPIGQFYEAKKEWLASQPLSGSEGQETPGETGGGEGTGGDGQRPSSDIPEATAPAVTSQSKKGGAGLKRPSVVLAGDQLFFTIPITFRPEIVALYNTSRELGLGDNLSTWVNSCIEGYYEVNGMSLALLYLGPSSTVCVSGPSPVWRGAAASQRGLASVRSLSSCLW